MNTILNVYKPVGITPYQAIQKLQETMPEYKDVTIGFAGRLDPLAHGVLLLMIGEATKEREKYLGLPKEYTFEALFGVQTDTYDALGYIQSGQARSTIAVTEQTLQTFIKNKLGKQIQPYPPFSSKEVQGKPLHWWAKNNKLSEITIPSREVEIFDFQLTSMGQLTTNELKKKVETQINAVQGQFRQEETRQKWNVFFETNKTQQFPTAKFKLHCSSGTYVRGLVHELGRKLGIGAITLEIFRTKVGAYCIKDAITLSL